MGHSSRKEREEDAQRRLRESLDRGPPTTWRREIGDGVVAEGNLRGGIPHGSYREWFPGGQLRIERTYRYGKIDGVCRQFSADGRLLAEFQMSDGDGIFAEYWDTGVLKLRWLCFHLAEKPCHAEEFFDVDGKRAIRSYTLKGASCRTRKRFVRELEKYGLTLPPEDHCYDPEVWKEFAGRARTAERRKIG